MARFTSARRRRPHRSCSNTAGIFPLSSRLTNMLGQCLARRYRAHRARLARRLSCGRRNPACRRRSGHASARASGGSRVRRPIPRLRFCAREFAAVTIFAANRGAEWVEEIDAGAAGRRADHAAGTRRRRAPARAGRSRVPVGADRGRPLGEAADAALKAHPGFDIGAGLADLLESGAFVPAIFWRQPMTIAIAVRFRRRRSSPSPGCVDRVERIVGAVALPSLVQLVMRVRSGDAVLEVRHAEMGRLSPAQRHGGQAVHRRVHAASAGRALSVIRRRR